MIVTITQSGGYAGGEQRLPLVDTGALDPERAVEVERHVADLSAAVAAEGEGPVGADMPTYTVEAIDEEGVRTWRVIDDDDLDRPPVRALRRLLEAAQAGP